MAVRYRNTTYSLAGTVWTVDIYDSLYTGAVSLFTTDGNAFTLSYKGLSERMDSQLASTLTLPIAITDSTIQSFILETLTAQEERFVVKVYKNTVLEWVGVLLSDQVDQEDIYYPSFIDLTFTDGLARLKDIDYNDGATVPAHYSGREAIITHLSKILSKTGTASLYASDTFIQTTINWYDVRHVYNPAYCPFYYTNIDHAIFYTYKDDGTVECKKTSVVLDAILKLFNARILMAGGHWHIIQTQEYARNTTYSRTFTKTGSTISYSATNFKITPPVTTRKSGGGTKYFAPLKQVSKIYKTKRSPYENDSILPLPITLYSSAVYNLLSPVGINDVINVEGNIRTWYRSTAVYYTNLYSQFLLRIILTKVSDGSKIYLKDYGNGYQWTNTASSVAVKVGPYNAQFEFNEEYQIAFTVLYIPYEYTGEFQFYFNGLYTEPSYPYSLRTGETWNHEIIDFKIVVDKSQNDVTFKVTNSLPSGSPVASTIELKVADTFIGDGPTARNLGRLQTNNLTAYADSSAWGVHNSTPRININQLSVNENLKGQRIPTDKYSGSFISTTLNAMSAIVWGAKVFVPISVTMNPSADEISGEWFNVIIPPL